MSRGITGVYGWGEGRLGEKQWNVFSYTASFTLVCAFQIGAFCCCAAVSMTARVTADGET